MNVTPSTMLSSFLISANVKLVLSFSGFPTFNHRAWNSGAVKALNLIKLRVVSGREMLLKPTSHPLSGSSNGKGSLFLK